MAKFINLSGKRLLIKQLTWIHKNEIDNIEEPDDAIIGIIKGDDEHSKESYLEKAEQIIRRFDIEECDFVHISGISFNLSNALMSLVKANFVYSKIKKIQQNSDYIIDFEYFIPAVHFMP